MMVCQVKKYGPGEPRVEVWLDRDEAAYHAWMIADPDGPPVDMPEPTYVIPGDDMDKLVVAWLQGPMGPVGPIGAPGMAGRDA
jgi:hypothetical protein